MKHALTAVVVVAVLAGCFQPAPAVEPAFDGDAAYMFVATLAGPHAAARVPGHASHGATADWLADGLTLPGWTVTQQAFNGSEYGSYDAGAVSRYRDAPWCQDDDRADLANLTFHNVIAERLIPGKPTWILGAHWDAKEEANQDADPARRTEPVPAANDGASGVGVLLQLAAHISAGDLDPSVGLIIVLFDGEDGFEDCHPVAGSLVHAATLDQHVDAMILLDMVGDPNGRFIRERLSVETAPGLVDTIWQHADAVGDDRFLAAPTSSGWHCSVLDDHVPYAEAGIPVVDIIDYGRANPRCAFPPYWHTSGDTMDNISAEALGMIGDVLWLTLQDETV